MPYNMPAMMITQPPQIIRPAPQPQAQAAPQPAKWQQSAAPAPSVVRGVAGNPPPQPSPARGEGASKFVLPRPEALGVATSLSVPAPTPAAPVQVDWNQIQARLARLNVLEYQKARVANGVQVRLLLPQQQRVDASGETEAAAILNALQQAETRRAP